MSKESKDSLTEQVKTNLEYQNLWTNISFHDIVIKSETLHILSGYPPNKLSSNDNISQLEWIIPIFVNSQDVVNVKQIDHWFRAIETISNSRPKRLTIALVHDDSTIVYYFIHDGVTKPNQN